MKASERGFTLVELMVALLIFGLLAAAGVALFGYALRAQGGVTARLDGNDRQVRLIALLTADLAQVVPRLSRDATGQTRAAFSGTNGVGAAPVLAFVRGGVSSENEGRPGLQRVEWAVREGRLLRIAYLHPDGDGAPRVSVLAEGLDGVSARYRFRDWADNWSPERPEALPRAVELTLRQGDRPPFTMAFLVGATLP